MKRFLALAAMVAVLIGAIDVLGDLTQSRPDRVPVGSRSTVTFKLTERGYLQTLSVGAEALVATCLGTTSRRLTSDVVEVAPAQFRFEVTPALGRDQKKKMVGCLQDATIDKLRGDVVAVSQTGVDSGNISP